ncbi:putative quinol monooxygenase [Flavobacterium sp. A45]|uniref:putative quinol monooxygenase n=1 Tax=Flavobacterium sp. A45 TaxID=1945862 RepID=UPI0009850322|nr:putative quinol monooxygenase [Flavobacterium sp. A45]OOG68035.1 antibiotic biosynthesis monooxygenase [Flavobacterium sp. A45]
MKINLTVIIKSKPEYREELKAILVDLTKNSKEEAACLQYDLHHNLQDPNVFILHEVWKNQEGLVLHKEQSHFLKFNEASELFLEEKITVFETSRIG